MPALEITPLLREPLCLVMARASADARKAGHSASTGTARRRSAPATVKLRELPAYPLVLPERTQSLRKLLQTQATLAGVTLDIACEVSSIPAIIDLVCARMGHAVLTESAVAASGRGAELVTRRIVAPELPTVLCLAQSATKPPTPLIREAGKLVKGLVGGTA